MKHHDNVSAAAESCGVAGLLIAAIPSVPRMTERMQPELARQRNCAVRTGVIGENEVVNDFPRNLFYNAIKGSSGIVCGKHDGDFATIQHPGFDSDL